MLRLSAVVLLFAVLLQPVFGAGFEGVKNDGALGAKVTAALAKAGKESVSQSEPWQTSAKAYAAEFKKELAKSETIADTNFNISEDTASKIDPLSQEGQRLVAAAASFTLVENIKDIEDKDLMFIVLKMPEMNKKMAEKNQNQEELYNYILKFSDQQQNFDAEKEFANPTSKALYIKILTNLKKVNESAAKTQKGTPDDFVKFVEHLSAIFS